MMSANYIPPKAGDIIDTEGRLLGQHAGLWSFTIGQGARLPGQNHKMYVARKDTLSNKMVVVDRKYVISPPNDLQNMVTTLLPCFELSVITPC
jgi:tRNA U34 2-thiouridine synthase MnmA/TrmU